MKIKMFLRDAQVYYHKQIFIFTNLNIEIHFFCLLQTVVVISVYF